MKYFFVVFILVVGLYCSPKLSPDSSWGGQRWILTEMKGVPVQLSEGRRDAYITFEVAEKKFAGNGGCNQINGSYSIDKKGHHLRFTGIGGTKMSCKDIAFENTFLTTLVNVDGYEQRGTDLLLNRKKEVLLRLTARPNQY